MCAHRGGAAFAGTASVRVPPDFRQQSVRLPAEIFQRCPAFLRLPAVPSHFRLIAVSAPAGLAAAHKQIKLVSSYDSRISKHTIYYSIQKSKYIVFPSTLYGHQVDIIFLTPYNSRVAKQTIYYSILY